MGILETKTLDHHGIVAATCEELRIKEIVDKLIPKKDNQKRSYGELVVAMIVNGLGFTTQPLYLTSRFFKDKPLEILFGEDIKYEDFNDDALGRSLDRLYEYGCDILFSRVAYEVCKDSEINTKFQHLDTTVMQLEGKYDTATELIRFGRPKNGRQDLKQFLISMMVSNDGGVPLLADVIAGNASDKKHFREVLKNLGKSMKDSKEEIYHIADAVLYNQASLDELSKSPIKFITRVPSSLKEAKNLFDTIPENDMNEYSDNYKILGFCNEYGGVKQRWVLVFSKAAYKKEIKTLRFSLRKERKQLRKEINKLSNRSFLCREDARKEIDKLLNQSKFHEVKSSSVTEKERKKNPKKVFKVTLTVKLSKEKVKYHKKQKGKFIVATNELNELKEKLSDTEILSYYKDQSKVERGFRFLNDPLCMADAVYLKNENRIKALATVMCLCLLVYSTAQRKLRQVLKEQNTTIPNQINKETQRPTLKWILQLFQGVHVIYQRVGNKINKIVSNMDDLRKRILELLGHRFQSKYLSFQLTCGM